MPTFHRSDYVLPGLKKLLLLTIFIFNLSVHQFCVIAHDENVHRKDDNVGRETDDNYYFDLNSSKPQIRHYKNHAGTVMVKQIVIPSSNDEGDIQQEGKKRLVAFDLDPILPPYTNVRDKLQLSVGGDDTGVYLTVDGTRHSIDHETIDSEQIQNDQEQSSDDITIELKEDNPDKIANIEPEVVVVDEEDNDEAESHDVSSYSGYEEKLIEGDTKVIGVDTNVSDDIISSDLGIVSSNQAVSTKKDGLDEYNNYGVVEPIEISHSKEQSDEKNESSGTENSVDHFNLPNKVSIDNDGDTELVNLEQQTEKLFDSKGSKEIDSSIKQDKNLAPQQGNNISPEMLSSVNEADLSINESSDTDKISSPNTDDNDAKVKEDVYDSNSIDGSSTNVEMKTDIVTDATDREVEDQEDTGELENTISNNDQGSNDEMKGNDDISNIAEVENTKIDGVIHDSDDIVKVNEEAYSVDGERDTERYSNSESYEEQQISQISQNLPNNDSISSTQEEVGTHLNEGGGDSENLQSEIESSFTNKEEREDDISTKEQESILNEDGKILEIMENNIEHTPKFHETLDYKAVDGDENVSDDLVSNNNIIIEKDSSGDKQRDDNDKNNVTVVSITADGNSNAQQDEQPKSLVENENNDIHDSSIINNIKSNENQEEALDEIKVTETTEPPLAEDVPYIEVTSNDKKLKTDDLPPFTLSKNRNYSPENQIKNASNDYLSNVYNTEIMTTDESEIKSNTIPKSESANHDFVAGLDDIHKFFEDVDPPDELDPGAGGLSLEEVIKSQGIQIIKTRIKKGIHFFKGIIKKIRLRLNDNDNKGADLSMKINENIEAVRNFAIESLENIVEFKESFVEIVRELFDNLGFSRDDDDDNGFESLYDEDSNDDEELLRQLNS